MGTMCGSPQANKSNARSGRRGAAATERDLNKKQGLGRGGEGRGWEIL